ncbi:MAG TPA: MbnH family di-heme enzyme [Rhodocyclaceae bacterium]|nr:MbnH family di-heme enzyme [Rhodocyclaceae bacterium]
MKSANKSPITAALLLGGALLSSAAIGAAPTAEWQWQLPPGFPQPAVPADNPMSAAKVELGRHLFYDKRLSGNGTTSCGTCHLQKLAFTDGKARATGSTGEHTARSAQHLANVAWNATYTWANPALTTLERQMLVPLFGDSPVEMGLNDGNKADVLARFKNDADYRQRFASVFSGETEPVTIDNIVKAIAAFQRTLISGDAKFDRYQNGTARLTASELRGKNLFFGEKAECFHCHGSFNFNDQTFHAKTRQVETPFHNTGLYNTDGQGAYPTSSQGIIEISGKPEDMGKYRAPSLRNVAVTAPYMHDGSIATLKEVIATYAAGGRKIKRGPDAGDGRKNPHKSELIGQIQLSRQEQTDLLNFLNTLTDRHFLKDPRYADPFAKHK